MAHPIAVGVGGIFVGALPKSLEPAPERFDAESPREFAARIRKAAEKVTGLNTKTSSQR